MNQWKRILYYLMLNVLVSACTTFAVLFIWDRTHSPIPGGLLLPALSQSSQTQTPAPDEPAGPVPTPTRAFIAYQVQAGDDFPSIASKFGVSEEELIRENGFTKDQPLGQGEVLRIPPTPTPGGEAEAAIDSVIGAGDPSTERVLIKHSGSGEISLAGWRLEDGDGNAFIFPDLTLISGAVNVWTGSGSNTVVDLYWGLDQAVWTSGETVMLRDAQGEERGTYTVP